MTIAELMEAVRGVPETHQVFFDFCNQCPVDIDSSRGDYAEPALAWGEQELDKTTGNWGTSVAGLRVLLKRAMTETFVGYKGGEYRYHKNSPLWVDNYGEWSATGVLGVHVGEHPWHGDAVVLVTGPAELDGERFIL
jgi:hypothetical protein